MQFVIFRTSYTHPISLLFLWVFYLILFAWASQCSPSLETHYVPKNDLQLETILLPQSPKWWDYRHVPLYPTLQCFFTKTTVFSFSPIRDRTRTGVNSVVQHIPSNRKARSLIPDMGRKTLHLWTSTDFWIKT